MRQTYKIAAGVVASLGLGFAVATAYASPGQMGAGMEHGKGGMHHGMAEGMQHGKGGEQHAEMRKRAQEKGVTLHEGRGPRTGAPTEAPATTEHQH